MVWGFIWFQNNTVWHWIFIRALITGILSVAWRSYKQQILFTLLKFSSGKLQWSTITVHCIFFFLGSSPLCQWSGIIQVSQGNVMHSLARSVSTAFYFNDRSVTYWPAFNILTVWTYRWVAMGILIGLTLSIIISLATYRQVFNSGLNWNLLMALQLPVQTLRAWDSKSLFCYRGTTEHLTWKDLC